MHGSPRGEPKEYEGKIQKEEVSIPTPISMLAHGHVIYKSILALGDQNITWKFHWARLLLSVII